MSKSNYSKKEIINILYASAKKYFQDFNFMHLTGIKYIYGAEKFFQHILQKNIEAKSLKIANKVFTKLKLDVLENAMNISNSAKRIGDYNYSKVNVQIEKVVGNIHYCIGFSKRYANNKKSKYYYPKTLIQDNFKSNVIQENKIIAILSKEKNQRLYDRVTYLYKNIKLKNIYEQETLKNKIDFKKLKSKNADYQKK